MAEAPVKLGDSLAHLGLNTYQTFANQSSQDQLSSRLDNINRQYRSGMIDKNGYKSALDSFMQDSNNLMNLENATSKAIQQNGKQLVSSSIDTASTVATLMTGGLESLAAPGLDVGVKATAQMLKGNLLDAALSPAEDAVGKIIANKALFDSLPGVLQKPVSAAFTESLQAGAKNMTTAQIARGMVANVALKYPLAYSQLSSTGNQIYGELQKGKYGDAVNTMAFNALLLLSGGPIGQALKYGGKALGEAGKMVFGNSSFLDTLSQNIGDKNPAGLFNALQKNPDAIKAFQALEATNVAAEHGKAADGAYRVINGLAQSWGDMSNMTHDNFVKQVMKWHEVQTKVDEFGKANGIEGLVVGRQSAADRQRISKFVTSQSYDSQQHALDTWETFKSQNPGAAWANNENLDKQMQGIISRNWNKPDVMKEAITSIKAQKAVKDIPDALFKSLAKDGYIIIKPNNLEAPFKQSEAPIASRFAGTSAADRTLVVGGSVKATPFTQATTPLPVLGHMGELLTKMGLSPQAAPQRVYDVYNANFAEELAKTGLVYHGLGGEDLKGQADKISKQLANYVHDMPNSLRRPPVTDYRQLTTKEIGMALGVGDRQANQIADAISQSMLKVPLAIKGLGNKLLDLNYKIPLMGKYLRYQGAIRYAWNPVFQSKLAIKGEILTQLATDGTWPTIAGMNTIMKTVFPEQYGRLGEIQQLLVNNHMFEAGMAGEAADETSAGYSAMSRANTGADHLVASQRRAMSALVGSMSDKAGMPAEDFIKAFPQETRDAIQTVLHYNPRAGFLNSPMARTLNFAFFPFRFNLKVSTAVAGFLGRQPAITQFAVIKGFMNASSFLQSPAGQAWYSQNSDVIGLLEYFSPVETLSTVSAALGHLPGSVTQFGSLGGLPFGWIPALLSSQGLISTSQPYVNPKTGAVSSEYVPINARGKLESAIETFLGQMFTYPGGTVGLPSKSTITSKVAEGVTGGSSADFNKQQIPQSDLTPQQQQFQQQVQQLNGTLQQAKQAKQAPPQTSTGMTVPSLPTPVTAPRLKGSRVAKKKESQFTPQAMPGQSQLGVVPAP
jgi:hypothetical protein